MFIVPKSNRLLAITITLFYKKRIRLRLLPKNFKFFLLQLQFGNNYR